MSLLDGLSAMQKKAVEIIDDDLEIIACAGAGKTGVVTRRIINILKSKPDVLPENIVAFTFTRKAAEELKSRIYELGKRELGDTRGFAHMYIGTIHGFCIKMLQEYIPEFQKYDVLDEIHAKLFVERYYDECGMCDLDLKKYVETGLFISVMNVLNENWFEQDKWNDVIKTAFEKYKKKLYSEKKFDYALILQEMINQLEGNQEFAAIVKDKVKYLTVDEYQDINPIQERLIQKIKEFGANLCVVGDDDQTIYQFRGSDSRNILTFQKRYGINNYTGIQSQKVKNILRRMFSKGKKTKYKFIALDNNDFYAFVINNVKQLKVDFKSVTAQMGGEQLSFALEPKTTEFSLPEMEIYKYSEVKKQMLFRLNVYKEYTNEFCTDRTRSLSERLFERYCETNQNVKWFYKNGDKGQQYLSMVYIDALQNQWLFYPDYIVHMKDGKDWIIETKGGEQAGHSKNIDVQTGNKFIAFKKYAERYNLNWGFVRDYSEELYINNTEYVEDMSDENWKSIEDVL